MSTWRNHTEHVWCCRHAPFLIAFQERAQVFTTVVGQDRMEQREMGMRQGYGWGRQFFVTIHRTSLLQVSGLKTTGPSASLSLCLPVPCAARILPFWVVYVNTGTEPAITAALQKRVGAFLERLKASLPWKARLAWHQPNSQTNKCHCNM